MNSPAIEPIRLTHCIGSMRRGGTEHQLAALISRLSPERFNQSLVLFQGGGELLESIPPTCEVVDLRYSMSFSKYDPRFYAAMSRALFLYIRHLRSFQPDIVHGWLYWANVLSVMAARVAGVETVLTSRRQLGVFKDGRPNLQRIENFCNRLTHGIVANSEAVRADVLRRENVSPDSIQVIHNGVDVLTVDPEVKMKLRSEWGLPEFGVVAVVLANFHPYKGHSDCLKVLKQLHSDFPDFYIVFAGRDQGAEGSLREESRNAGLENHVRFIGERGDVRNVLAASDLLIHPSRQEGFPNAILEAMSAGLPVVAYDLDACCEAIADGESGQIVPMEDIDALTRAVKTLIRDSPLRQRMGEAGIERIKQKFSIDQMVMKMSSLYEAICPMSLPKVE